MKIRHIQCMVGAWIAATLLSAQALEVPPSVQVTVESPLGAFVASGYNEEGIKKSWENTPQSRVTFPFSQGGYVRIYSKALTFHFACINLAADGTPFMEYHLIPHSCSNKPRKTVVCALDKKKGDQTGQKSYLCIYHPDEEIPLQ